MSQLEESRSANLCYGDFFRNAPQLNPNRVLIKGVICGVRVEEIEDPLMWEIRCLDKLIDELANGHFCCGSFREGDTERAELGVGRF